MEVKLQTIFRIANNNSIGYIPNSIRLINFFLIIIIVLLPSIKNKIKKVIIIGNISLYEKEIKEHNELINNLLPIKRLQILKCVSCKFKDKCNILEKEHLKDKNSRLYYLKLQFRSE